MNSNRRIFIFVLSSIILYLSISILAIAFNWQWKPLKRINLVSEIFIQEERSVATDSKENDSEPPIIIEKTAERDFNRYTLANNITDFSTNSNRPSLTHFMKKLADLKQGKKTKIRIAYFGDSMIEGDLITETIRKLLQTEFGGQGVGFVPIMSPVSKSRRTATCNYSGNWDEESFKTAGKNNKLFLSGYLFRGNNSWAEIKDRTITDSNAVIEKKLFYGYAETLVSINANGNAVNIPANEQFGEILIDKGNSPYAKISSVNNNIPLYGISFESESGIILDNFSFRGISGVEFTKIDSAFLGAIASKTNYDLLVFQYGVNVLYKPDNINFNWYARLLMPSIKNLKNNFSNADFIIVSTADRAFRYDGEYKSAKGIDSLIKIQATAAYETGASFYNQFETMGGHNSIVEWANAKPPLANKDYIHPNLKGAEILANHFFNAIMADYKKYTQTIKK